MAISIFPVASSSSVNSYGYTVASAKTTYKTTQAFSAAVYVITCPSGVVATVAFFDSSGNVYTATTSSSTVSFNLATDCIGAYISTDSGTDGVVVITLSSLPLSGTSLSGTLDTVTSTSTYNQTGTLYVLAIGGGGGGGGGVSPYGGGGGGASVGTAKLVKTNTATSITIGAAGNGGVGTDPTGNGNAGGTTSFGSLVTSAGGNGGGRGYNGSAGGGTYGGGRGSRWDGSGVGAESGTAVPLYITNITNGTNGGGGGGGGGSGAGSGIGTGGNSSAAANGYGAGGGGGNGAGGAGSPGVVYVLRGF